MLELVAPSFLNVGRYLNLAKREILLFKSSTGCFDWVSLSFKIVHATDLHLLKVQAVMIWTQIIVCPSTMNSVPQTGLLAFPALVPLLVLCLQPGMPSRWTNPDKVLPVPLFPSMLLPQWDTSCIFNGSLLFHSIFGSLSRDSLPILVSSVIHYIVCGYSNICWLELKRDLTIHVRHAKFFVDYRAL